MSENQKKTKTIALYLPQYHPTEENNQWWGKGFTEWNNVVKGKKIVKGQYQPHIPADLGFYDLRLPEIRKQQAEMAIAHGIYGFCYYHYWFHGKRMLEQPINEVLKSGEPDFPFCFCWANETWSRNWDGLEKKILIKQEYSTEDHVQHIEYLCTSVFNDKRYIKVNGKPVFIIYRPSSIPDIKAVTDLWRKEVKKYGFDDLYFLYFWAFDYGKEPNQFGMDAAVLFTPNPIPLPSQKKNLIDKILYKLKLHPKLLEKHKIKDYAELAEYCSNMKPPDDFTLFPCITPMWDNYARRRGGGATIYVNSTPEIYQKWLSKIFHNWKTKESEDSFLFINAWNEWAEGNHLEPCEYWGLKYLEATKNVLKNNI